MSDQSAENKESSAEWKPISPDTLENIDNRYSKQSIREGFNILFFDNKDNSDGSDDFISLYQQEYGDLKEDETDAALPLSDDIGADNVSQNNAEKIVDSEEIMQNAYNEGFAKGEKDGFNAAEDNAAKAVKDLLNIISKIDRLWEELVNIYENEIVRLICKAAEKVVLGKVATDHEVVKRTILHAFEVIPKPVDVTVYVNPEDYEYIESIKDDFSSLTKNMKHISVESDPSVSRGGCKIDTESGLVDGSLESRLDLIKQAIIETGGEGTGMLD